MHCDRKFAALRFAFPLNLVKRSHLVCMCICRRQAFPHCHGSRERPQQLNQRSGSDMVCLSYCGGKCLCKHPFVASMRCPLCFNNCVRHCRDHTIGYTKTGYMEEAKQGSYENGIWRPMALRIGLLESSALQNDGFGVPVILQCPTLQETNPKGHSGPNFIFS